MPDSSSGHHDGLQRPGIQTVRIGAILLVQGDLRRRQDAVVNPEFVNGADRIRVGIVETSVLERRSWWECRTGIVGAPLRHFVARRRDKWKMVPVAGSTTAVTWAVMLFQPWASSRVAPPLLVFRNTPVVVSHPRRRKAHTRSDQRPRHCWCCRSQTSKPRSRIIERHPGFKRGRVLVAMLIWPAGRDR